MNVPEWAIWTFGSVAALLVSMIGYMVRLTLEQIDRRLETISTTLLTMSGQLHDRPTHEDCALRRERCPSLCEWNRQHGVGR